MNSPLPDTPTKRKLIKAIKKQFPDISKTKQNQLLRDLKDIALTFFDLRTQPQLKIKEWYEKGKANRKKFELNLSDDLEIEEKFDSSNDNA